MSTAQARRILAEKNQILIQQNNRLKDKKHDIAEHLSTIIRRCKQMQSLKNSLRVDLQQAIERSKIIRNKKKAYIDHLYTDIKKLEGDLLVEVTQLKKLQGEYEVCLQDYDAVLKLVTEEIQACRIIEANIVLQKQNNASIKAMIFDYERLKRVLEEEKNYFKELSNSEEKSHQERVKQLQKILENLKKEEQVSEHTLKLNKFRAGFGRLHHLFRQKIKQYAQKFIRSQFNSHYKTEISIKTFKNCLQLANLKHKFSTRKLFYQWHHNVFPKEILKNLVEQTTINDVKSRKRLSTLNKMVEEVYDKNLAIFHLYQKGKYLSIITNKIARKDLHYGFNRWRKNYQVKASKLSFLSKILLTTIPQGQKRKAFKLWKTNAALQSRLLLANHLLNQYINTRELCRVFRKWRFEVYQHELRVVNRFVHNVKLQNKISSRINYEKRKSKVLTALAIRFTKIKLRNYFIKYWSNVKNFTINKEKENIKEQKEKFSGLRATHKSVVAEIEAKNQKISLKIFKVFMLNSKLRPAFKKWQNSMLYMRRQSETIYHLALKKEAKTKIYVMNQFRKCIQYFEKKEMHQILTDLNNKMEAINQKSTNFREKLKKCIEDLGIVASKKIDYLFNYSVMCQQRVYYNTDLRKNIRKLYKEYILYRFQTILMLYGEKKVFLQLAVHAKNQTKEIKLEKLFKIYMRDKVKREKSRVFYAIKNSLKASKSCFQRMSHAENVFLFYRMATAFVAIERKNCAQKIKATNKKIASSESVLKTIQSNIVNLEDQKKQLEGKMSKIFAKFVTFQNRSQQLKQKRNLNMLTKRYFAKYRQNVQQKIYAEKILTHFIDFISQKNRMIFWKGANALRYQNAIASVKQQLGKLNKKKKAFEQKNQKGIGDIEKRMSQAEAVHGQKFKYYAYYLKKFQSILKFYEDNHHNKQKLYYTKIIFNAWKNQYQATKRLVLGTNKILQRNLVHDGYQRIAKMIRDEDSQLKSQYLCAQILERKARNCMKDSIILWRVNMRKKQCEKLEDKTMEMILRREDVADECKQKGKLVGQERLRLKRKRMLSQCFMALKAQLNQKIYIERYKISPITELINENLLRKCINGLKWYMFYKRTKRTYLKYKTEKYERQLKSDVFLSLKIYRQEHYKFVSKVQGVVDNVIIKFTKNAFNKIINLGAYNRDELNYERRRALRHLVMNKVTKCHIIKRKIMAKWYAWLIPRHHYLPNILKQLQISTLKKTFANVREHAYWNPIYIKKAADHITSEGYSQINNATNNLVKEGYDPQEIKEYLTRHNDKDTRNIKIITNRMRAWGKNQNLVRAWNSWKQYVALKGKIRKSLSKVLKIAQGLGRYWNRWKSKDPKFNSILEKQSRGNMLQRYRDLGRLLKQYKRDVKDSKIYCQELKDVNDQYAEKNEEGIRIALSALSTNLKKGLKQGLQLWKTRVREYKKLALDERYDQLSQGISILLQQKNKLKYRIISIKQQNNQLKQKCNLGKQCGEILQKLMKERDTLSIDLADKQHNLKLLLEDNLRLKQKIRSAKSNAEKLINKVQNIENIQ